MPKSISSVITLNAEEWGLSNEHMAAILDAVNKQHRHILNTQSAKQRYHLRRKDREINLCDSTIASLRNELMIANTEIERVRGEIRVLTSLDGGRLSQVRSLLRTASCLLDECGTDLQLDTDLSVGGGNVLEQSGASVPNNGITHDELPGVTEDLDDSITVPSPFDKDGELDLDL